MRGRIPCRAIPGLLESGFRAVSVGRRRAGAGLCSQVGLAVIVQRVFLDDAMLVFGAALRLIAREAAGLAVGRVVADARGAFDPLAPSVILCRFAVFAFKFARTALIFRAEIDGQLAVRSDLAQIGGRHVVL